MQDFALKLLFERVELVIVSQFFLFSAVVTIFNIAGMIYIFVLNNTRPFQAVNNTLKHGDYFFILNIFCLAVSTRILQLSVDVWLFPYILVLFASIVIVMILNVICNRDWILNEQSSETTWVAV